MVILFQGDSVTDAGRSREDLTDLGPGYPAFTAQKIREDIPDADIQFVNRGVSGDRVRNLVARFDEDIAKINPDIITILIGVNDTWRKFDRDDPTSAEQFAETYETLLKMIKERTHAKIVIAEAFVLYNMGRNEFREDLDLKLDQTRLLAMKYADAYVPLDDLFAAACVGNDPRIFSDDGIHPNDGGRKFIAEILAPVVESLIK